MLSTGSNALCSEDVTLGAAKSRLMLDFIRNSRSESRRMDRSHYCVVGSVAEGTSRRARRRHKVWAGAAVLALLGTQSAFVAWAATNSGSASDGGNTVNVGAGSASSSPGEGGSQGHPQELRFRIGGRAMHVHTSARQTGRERFGAGGPTPGAWYFVKCPGKKLTIFSGALSWFPTGSPTVAGTPTLAPNACWHSGPPTP